LFLAYSLLASSAWAFPIAVIPLFVDDHSSSSASAGLVTGLMFLITVIVELRTPHLMHALGNRIVLPAGGVLMGVAPIFFLFTSDLWAMLAVPIARGAGLALVVVAATATAARQFPPGRRAEGLGLFGLSFTVPTVILTPVGVWLADSAGYNPVFAISIAIGVACIVLIPLIPADADEQDSPHGLWGIIRNPAILTPTIVFGISTLAAGVIIAYLALAVGEGVAAIGLFLYGASSSLARWVGGRVADAIGSGTILWWGMVVAGVGLAAVAATDVPVLVLIGLTVFGLGFGAVQNASIAVMFARAERRHVAHISVLWNLAFDAGMGIGAVGFGLVSDQIGYPAGFLIMAGLTLVAVVPAWKDRHPGIV
jgi:predicted MFS family arabinose efflux permease